MSHVLELQSEDDDVMHITYDYKLRSFNLGFVYPQHTIVWLLLPKLPLQMISQTLKMPRDA
jgi:hypothetical protein